MGRQRLQQSASEAALKSKLRKGPVSKKLNLACTACQLYTQDQSTVIRSTFKFIQSSSDLSPPTHRNFCYYHVGRLVIVCYVQKFVVFTLHTLPVRDCRLPVLMNLNRFVVRAFYASYKMSKGIKRLGETALQPEPKKPAIGHWANGLLAAMDDPNLRVYSDERVVVIKDRYPKAKFHFLVLPKEPLSSLKVVGLKHIDLLQYMHDVGQRIAKKEEHGNRRFK